MRVVCKVGLLTVFISVSSVWAQSSSIMRMPQRYSVDNPATRSNISGPSSEIVFSAASPRAETRAATRAIEKVAMFAVPTVPPRKFKPHDLITIIVRQQRKYEADAKLDTKKKWDIDGELSNWFRFYPRNRLGQDKLSNGNPGFAFKLDNKYKTDAENEREDKFTTRIGARVIDVKPNGNLVLEAKHEETHDEDKCTITLTGLCRSEDVGPDNTILSTQIVDLVLTEKNSGAVRDATSRGWVPKILDWAKPF